MDFHGMWGSYTDERRAFVLDQLAAAHVTWVRLDVSWAMLQPTSATAYDAWGVGFVDRVINMITARGMKPLVMLWLTPTWANGNAGYRVPPTDPADYARVAEWAARRWATQVPAWEVWNEPNLTGMFTGADPVTYTRLLQAAYPAFHRGSPSTTVVFGGTSYNDTTWIEKAYVAGAAGSFDAMATHPYMGIANAAPEAADDGSMYTLAHVAAVHSLMAKYGDSGKKIWFTELGWSTHANDSTMKNWQLGVTEQQQADYSVRTMQLVRSNFPYVSHVFFYTDRDDNKGNVHVDNFGLFRLDYSAKPMYAALKAYLTA
jgi:hypothetical protein